ncbi:tRNA N6-adenosine threonylcarbamoyltransferase, mitochondrial [Cytospora mali]|uniref:tRNA N6-adenosine threonylcarbamoyltransferase, mitochondrial n=1 Tax=Cytospora mali TaxID=578113 RepID=A0A194VPF8_CYTMA|nr:tRNA N6-adenosine threonylcarbamoyltransferase, mitochondrial [Valsa mali]
MARLRALNGLTPRPSLSLGLRARRVQAYAPLRCIRYRSTFYTLGIETSCDDTCVALLSRKESGTVILFHERITCTNKQYEGIHPLEAVESHTRNLPKLIEKALPYVGKEYGQRFAPSKMESTMAPPPGAPKVLYRPDLIAVTRGPGMKACLSIGISMAKALSVALSVPLIGVHHMQAHALTPHMEADLAHGFGRKASPPEYPFLTLLVSGGHTMLVYTTSSVDHRILASTQRGCINPQEKASPVAIGDMLDKCARVIVPEAVIPSWETVVYAQTLEHFVMNTRYCSNMDWAYNAPEKRQNEIEIYQSTAGWALPPPLRLSREMKFDFSGLGGMVRSIMQDKPDMPRVERAELGYHTMRLAFEHLGSRVILAMENDAELLANPPKHLILSGGVASNKFLRKVISKMLKARGFGDTEVTAPAPKWCTDNAAMIAYAGTEMYRSGWTTDNAFLPKSEWPIEQIIADTDCWIKKDEITLFEPDLGETGAQQGESSEPKLPDVKPAKAETAKAKPAKVEPTKAKPAKVEPAKPAKVKPAKAKPAKVEPAKANTAKADSAKATPAIVNLEDESANARHDGRSKMFGDETPEEERLRRVQRKLQRLLTSRNPVQRVGGNPFVVKPPSTPRPLAMSQEAPPQPSRLAPALPYQRPWIMQLLNQKPTESAADELVTAESKLGGSWTRKAQPPPPAARPAPRQLVTRSSPYHKIFRFSAPVQPPADSGKIDKAGKLDNVDGIKKVDRIKKVETGGHGRVRARSAEWAKTPRPKVGKSGEDVEKGKPMVRLLHPLPPHVDDVKPSPKSTSDTGALQKGLSVLKRWAGL